MDCVRKTSNTTTLIFLGHELIREKEKNQEKNTYNFEDFVLLEQNLYRKC